MLFENRSQAGAKLAGLVADLHPQRPVVFALPRGGVPVALEVARALGAPLALLFVRKLGAPGNPELAVGALAEDGTAVVDASTLRRTGMSEPELRNEVEFQRAELARLRERYSPNGAPLQVAGRSAIVVDDGLATGMTALAAVRALNARGAETVVVAAPVASPQAIAMLGEEADEVVCALVPEVLLGVGRWYEDFAPVSDEQVLAALAASEPS